MWKAISDLPYPTASVEALSRDRNAVSGKSRPSFT